MIFFAFFIALTSYLLSISGRKGLSFYHIVRVNESSSLSKLYLVSLKQQTYQYIPDLETVFYLGFNESNIKEVTLGSLQALFSNSSDIPAIHINGATFDDIIRVNMMRINVFQRKLFLSIEYIGEVINPSVIPHLGRLLSCTGDAWPTFQSFATEKIHCKWLNHSLYPFYSTDDYYGISSLNYRSINVTGQDPRITIFPHNNNIIFSYTNRFYNLWYLSMGQSVFSFNNSLRDLNNDLIPFNSSYVLANTFENIFFDPDLQSHQKNWSPFLYNNEILYIVSINPLKIVTTNNLSSKLHATYYSISEKVSIVYTYGHLRGGTNAIQLEDRYLSFFHSNTRLEAKKSGLKTYFMGAFTFTLYPPFKLLSYSPYPIIEDWLYEGEWDIKKNRGIDYCNFPMALFRENDTIYLSFGRNDHQGYLSSINLFNLLDSLEDV